MSKEAHQEFDVLRNPELPKRFRLWKHQWIGIPLLLAIPTLALLGTFDEDAKQVLATSNDLALSAQYPGKLRHGTSHEIVVSLENKSSRAMQDVRVEIESGYLNRFSEVQVTPEPKTPYQIDLQELAPGERRMITVNLRGGDDYGSHAGKIIARSKGAELASAELKSYVFP